MVRMTQILPFQLGGNHLKAVGSLILIKAIRKAENCVIELLDLQVGMCIKETWPRFLKLS